MSRNVFSPKRAEPIIAGWSGQKVIREIMAFLQGHGVSTWRAVASTGRRSLKITM